ncbi:FG-GAP repeat domain-containing protein [Rheinheimera gaetbuli]
MKYVACFILLLLLNISFLAEAADAELKKIILPHPPNGDMLQLTERKQLVVSGYSQFARWLSAVDLTDYSSRMLPLPDDAQFFSSATLAGEPGSQLVFLGLGGVSRLSEDGSYAQRIVAADSLYRVLDQNRLRSANFVVELGSGLSDFLIADFQHTHLYRQQTDGSFMHYALQIPALVQSWRNSPDYTPRKHSIVDVNMDGRPDLLFIWQGKFQAFLQQSDGSFSTEPAIMPWPVLLSSEQESDQRNDAGRSYSGQNIDTLRELTDLDGDGVADLVINREQLADALERNNSFRVHFGRIGDQGLSFNAEPDTLITTDTSPIDVVIDDFNNDGRKDFYIPSTHFGVGTIIRVLLRGSANLDIDFYLLNGQRQYPAKADFRQQATIDVSIGNLRYDMPLFQLADINGDGFKALLIGEGQNQLKVYQHDDKRLFSRRSERLKLDLPRDARKVKVMDLTGNGKDDLVLPFDSQEAESLRNQLHVLISR